jgi:hypothetical protein
MGTGIRNIAACSMSRWNESSTTFAELKFHIRYHKIPQPELSLNVVSSDKHDSLKCVLCIFVA